MATSELFASQPQLELPLKYCGASARASPTTSWCHSREKRRRVPKSKNSNGNCLPAAAGGEIAQLLNLRAEPAAALLDHFVGLETPEVQFIDDRQHEDLERHHVNLRSARE